MQKQTLFSVYLKVVIEFYKTATAKKSPICSLGLGLCPLTFQIHSRIGDSAILITEPVCVPLLSRLHGLEIEHNELIDDMTKVDFPELALILVHWFPPSEHQRPISQSTTNLTCPTT